MAIRMNLSEDLEESAVEDHTFFYSLPSHFKFWALGSGPQYLSDFISSTSLFTTLQLQKPSFSSLNLLKHSSCLCTCWTLFPGGSSPFVFAERILSYYSEMSVATESRRAPLFSLLSSQTITLYPHGYIRFSLQLILLL